MSKSDDVILDVTFNDLSNSCIRSICGFYGEKKRIISGHENGEIRIYDFKGNSIKFNQKEN
jgi:hypothetical protein